MRWAYREQRALIAAELLLDILPAASLVSGPLPLLAPRLLLLRRFPALPRGWPGAASWALQLSVPSQQARAASEGEDLRSETTVLRLVLGLMDPLWRSLQAQNDAVEKFLIEASDLPAENVSTTATPEPPPWACLENTGMGPEV